MLSQAAPDFGADACDNGNFTHVSLADFKSQKVVLFFYPLDFTFVRPTEILAFTDALQEFKKCNTVVSGCSVDSKFTHHAWAQFPREDAEIKGVNFPLISDLNKTIAGDYGVLLDAGISLRGLLIINKDAVLRPATINHLDLGQKHQ